MLLALVKDHHPSTEFVYYLQHDFAFKPGINHTALVNVMKENEDEKSYKIIERYSTGLKGVHLSTGGVCLYHFCFGQILNVCCKCIYL